ncbi:cytokinin hydroxylase-like isoform X1 [Zingiber officinale]|uniref:cytokinin hydroxylase-like isoform X1 n=1 Tax=Zingiber officinale TaxID=94328 RepID=UPI001C4D6DB1|nr:cytokinin hydroxylase-like isoform X1 [Zingiber officinale]
MGLLLVITTLVFVFFLLTVLTVAWITFFTYYWTPMHIRRFMRRQGVHGPSPKFLVGNLKDSASMVSASIASDMDFISHDIVSRLMPHYVLWSKIYGKKFIYWYGSEPRLCLTDTDMIKELLSSKYVQLTGKSWLQRQGSKNLIGDGLLMANGSNWFHQRHVVAPAFMADKLKSHVGYMVECTRQMIKSLVEDVGSGQSEVEIGAYMTRLTGDIISRTGFDSSYEKGKKIFQLLERLQSLTAQSSRYLWIPGSRYFPSKYRREIKQLKEQVDRVLMEIIDCRKEAAEFGRSSASGRGLLEMLLDEVQKKRDDGLSYSLKLVMDECKTFFFAGHETSALLLTWTIMLLATNPSWQEKARSEVAEVCGRRPPSAEDLPKLTSVNRSYEKNLHLIINESLRLYPPATLLPRMAFQDMKLGDLMIPKGLSIWIPVLAIHHDEDIWGKDANEFQPERFAGRSFSLTRHFLPFAAGPRNCVGQAYAMMEAKIVLAMFLSAFSFTISNNYRHAPINVLTLRPKHGVLVHLTPLDY